MCQTRNFQGHHECVQAFIQGILPFLREKEEEVRREPVGSEAELPVREMVVSQMLRYDSSNHLLKHLAHHREQGYRLIVDELISRIFLVDRNQARLLPQ